MSIDLSLNQGKKYNHYQNRIKKGIENKNTNIGTGIDTGTGIEGFQGKKDVLNNAMAMRYQTDLNNSQDNLTLQNLIQQYNRLSAEYIKAYQTMTNEAGRLFNRSGSNNTYKGKNVKFSSGEMGYVTQLGDYKRYPNSAIFTNTSGKNGCPASSRSVNIEGSPNINNKGVLTNTSPNLLVGSDIVNGQSCGNEGQNVYVNQMTTNSSAEYLRCYNNYQKNTSRLNAPEIISQANTYFKFQQNMDDSGFNTIGMKFSNNFAFTTIDNWPCVSFNNNGYLMSNAFSLTKQLSMSYWAYVNRSNLEQETVSIGNGTFGNTSVFQGDLYNNNLATFVALPNFWTYVRGPYTANQWIHLTYTIDLLNDTINFYVNGTLYSSVKAGNNQWRQLNAYHFTFGRASDSAGRYLNGGGLRQFMAFNKILTPKNIKDIYDYTNSPESIRESPVYDTSVSAMEPANMYGSTNTLTSFDNCKLYAKNNGYKFFGLKNVQTDGTGNCMVANDFSKVLQFGEATNNNAYSVWNSGSPGYLSALVNNGQLCLIGSSGKNPICFPNNPLADCVSGGIINPDGLAATYGANCPSRYNVITGNATDKVKQALAASSDKSQMLIGVNNGVFGDPAVGCGKSFDTAYKCGNTWKTGRSSEGQSYIYDCRTETSNCKCFLALQSDGNMCIYKGIPGNIIGYALWCSYTHGQQKSTNPNWVASKGKYGRSYLLQGETLEINEWIGSDDGAMKLIMQADGYLSLLMTETKSACSSQPYGYGGGANSTAVYQMEQVGNKSLIGKIGYIDGNSNLREYPSSMIGLSSQYDVMRGMNSWGNDLPGMPIPNSTTSSCKIACDDNKDCHGFIYNNSNKNCWLKNQNVYPQGILDNSPNDDLHVRRPQVFNNVSCSKRMTPIDTIQYSNYVKGGLMTPEVNCGLNITSLADNKNFINITNQLMDLEKQISRETVLLEKNNIDINSSMVDGKNTIANDLVEYNKTKDQIGVLLSKQNIDNNRSDYGKNINYNIMEGMLNMQDIDAMVSDSDLNVLKNNSQYILWTIIALGAIIITVNVVKK